MDILDRKITKHICELPGFDGLTTFTETCGGIIESEILRLSKEEAINSGRIIAS